MPELRAAGVPVRRGFRSNGPRDRVSRAIRSIGEGATTTARHPVSLAQVRARVTPTIRRLVEAILRDAGAYAVAGHLGSDGQGNPWYEWLAQYRFRVNAEAARSVILARWPDTEIAIEPVEGPRDAA